MRDRLFKNRIEAFRSHTHRNIDDRRRTKKKREKDFFLEKRNKKENFKEIFGTTFFLKSKKKKFFERNFLMDATIKVRNKIFFETEIGILKDFFL